MIASPTLEFCVTHGLEIAHGPVDVHSKTLKRTDLILLYLIATIPRLIGAGWLPNAFGDAYAYTEQIYYMLRAMLNGSFSLASLFGFWLPLYQLICDGISAVAGSPFMYPRWYQPFAAADMPARFAVDPDNNDAAAVTLRWSSFLVTGYLARNGKRLEVFRDSR